MSVEILARIQFAFTIAFHYIYPPLSIGLGLLIVIFEGTYLKTKDKQYEKLARFWIKIFALTFGIGVATGIVMEFEFGTNWAAYSRYVGGIFGSALAAEGIFAFALESGFLGILLFGWNRVKPVVHFIATIGVFLGSMFSAIWIVVANSWQQTPAGFRIEGTGMDAHAVITNFWDMVFNPSSVDRVLHVWIGAFLAGIFLVISVHAWYLLKNRFVDVSKKAIKIGLIAALILTVSQLFVGSKSADIVARYQPAKLAAMEGHFDSNKPAELYFGGWVDMDSGKTYGAGIPGGLSYLTKGDFQAHVKGLNDFEKKNLPDAVNAVFQFYHLMVALGITMILIAIYGVFRIWRKKLFTQRWFLRVLVVAAILPQIANQAGWFTAELGRQPWVVYGLLRTSNALSEAVSANQIIFSLIMFTVLYVILFALFVYLLNKKIKNGPDESEMIDQRTRQKEYINELT